MHVQDQNGSTNAQSMCMPSNRLCVDARPSYTNGPQVEELGSAAEEHVLKVRKPYTITKQRERWSEEEHNKFLEALKLYGRAWRRVEEHIGTKTAVQIRSHAQKFFTKVARASGSNDASTLKSIAIPPPRPKRKPIHPYPRKLGQSTSKEFPVLEQPQRCFSPTPSVSEQENRSPTSVLSPFGLDIKRPSTWNGPNNCTSPVSSASGSSSTGMLNDQEIGCQSPALSIEKTGCLSSAAVSAGMTMQDKSPMELDVGSGIDIPSNNDSSLEGTSLKLFGRTVLVADSQKSSTSTVGNLVECCKSLAVEDVLRGMDVESLPRMKSVQHVAQDDLSGGAPKNSWNSLPADVPSIFCCLPLHRDVTKSGEAPHFPLHVWSPYDGPFIGPQNTNLVEELHQTLGKKGAKEEVSWTSSYYSFGSGMLSSEQNNGSFNSLFTGQCKDEELKPALKLRPSENSTFKVHKPSSDKPVRGFMPYRRCVADKKAELPVMANKDADGKRAELCL